MLRARTIYHYLLQYIFIFCLMLRYCLQYKFSAHNHYRCLFDSYRKILSSLSFTLIAWKSSTSSRGSSTIGVSFYLFIVGHTIEYDIMAKPLLSTVEPLWSYIVTTRCKWQRYRIDIDLKTVKTIQHRYKYIFYVLITRHIEDTASVR